MTTTGPLCSTCRDDYYLDSIAEVCVACDSDEATKQSEDAGNMVLPIVIGYLIVVGIVLVVAVNRPGPLQRWWNRTEERIMVCEQINFVGTHLS